MRRLNALDILALLALASSIGLCGYVLMPKHQFAASIARALQFTFWSLALASIN